MIADSTAPRRRYHHGNLRQALIEVATEMLDESGPSGLTLRALARRVGVTHAAPYRHFRDKAALLDAIAAEGHRALATLLHEARAGGEGADTARLRLSRLATTYLDFARGRPALYRLMSRPPPSSDPAKDGRSRVLDELGHAVDNLQRGQRPAPQDHRQLGYVVWAQLHGLAVLALDGVAAGDGVDALRHAAVQTLLTGITER